MTKFSPKNFRKSREILDQFDKSIKSYIKVFESTGLLALTPQLDSPGRVNVNKENHARPPLFQDLNDVDTYQTKLLQALISMQRIRTSASPRIILTYFFQWYPFKQKDKGKVLSNKNDLNYYEILRLFCKHFYLFQFHFWTSSLGELCLWLCNVMPNLFNVKKSYILKYIFNT